MSDEGIIAENSKILRNYHESITFQNDTLWESGNRRRLEEFQDARARKIISTESEKLPRNIAGNIKETARIDEKVTAAKLIAGTGTGSCSGYTGQTAPPGKTDVRELQLPLEK